MGNSQSPWDNIREVDWLICLSSRHIKGRTWGSRNTTDALWSVHIFIIGLLSGFPLGYISYLVPWLPQVYQVLVWGLSWILASSWVCLCPLPENSCHFLAAWVTTLSLPFNFFSYCNPCSEATTVWSLWFILLCLKVINNNQSSLTNPLDAWHCSRNGDTLTNKKLVLIGTANSLWPAFPVCGCNEVQIRGPLKITECIPHKSWLRGGEVDDRAFKILCITMAG